MNKFYRGSSIDASYQVSVHLAEGFQRRRLKCEKLTEDWRRTTDDGRRCYYKLTNLCTLSRMQGLTCLIKPYKTSMFRLFRWNTVRRRIEYLCFDVHSSVSSFGWGVSEEKIKMWKVNGRLTTDDRRWTTDAKWWQKLALPLARWAKKKMHVEAQIFYFV
jgi:hypothetical protein